MSDEICWVTPGICAEYIRTALEVFFEGRVQFAKMEFDIHPLNKETRKVCSFGKYSQLGKPLPYVAFSVELLLENDSPKSAVVLAESQNFLEVGKIYRFQAEWQERDGKRVVLVSSDLDVIKGQCFMGTNYHDRRVEPLQPKG